MAVGVWGLLLISHNTKEIKMAISKKVKLENDTEINYIRIEFLYIVLKLFVKMACKCWKPTKPKKK